MVTHMEKVELFLVVYGLIWEWGAFFYLFVVLFFWPFSICFVGIGCSFETVTSFLDCLVFFKFFYFHCHSATPSLATCRVRVTCP